MAYELELPTRLANQGWKVKIRDRERVEPPHVTILKKTLSWRYALRECGFLDRQPDPAEVPATLLRAIESCLPKLKEAWDRMYPENPVSSIAKSTSAKAGTKRKSTK